MKLIKYSLIAAVGVFLLPAPPTDSFYEMPGGKRINLETGEVLGAAVAAYSDVSGFCQRQRAVCNTAGQAFSAFEVRAKYNFQRLYEWSKDSGNTAVQSPQPTVRIKVEPTTLTDQQIDQIVTGSISANEKNKPWPMIVADAAKKASTNTLVLEDLLPQWRGPARTQTG